MERKGQRESRGEEEYGEIKECEKSEGMRKMKGKGERGRRENVNEEEPDKFNI